MKKKASQKVMTHKILTAQALIVIYTFVTTWHMSKNEKCTCFQPIRCAFFFMYIIIGGFACELFKENFFLGGISLESVFAFNLFPLLALEINFVQDIAPPHQLVQH